MDQSLIGFEKKLNIMQSNMIILWIRIL